MFPGLRQQQMSLARGWSWLSEEPGSCVFVAVESLYTNTCRFGAGVELTALQKEHDQFSFFLY